MMSDFNGFTELMQWLLAGNKVTTGTQIFYLDK